MGVSILRCSQTQKRRILTYISISSIRPHIRTRPPHRSRHHCGSRERVLIIDTGGGDNLLLAPFHLMEGLVTRLPSSRARGGGGILHANGAASDLFASSPPTVASQVRCRCLVTHRLAPRSIDVIEHRFPLWCRRNALVDIYFPTSSEWSFFKKNYLLFVGLFSYLAFPVHPLCLFERQTTKTGSLTVPDQFVSPSKAPETTPR